MPRDEMETRIFIMQCYFTHDSMRIVGDARTKTDSVFYRVQLTRGARVNESTVTTVAGPQSRWYVAEASMPNPGCAN